MIVDTLVSTIKSLFSYDLALLVVLLIAIWIGKLINDLLTRQYKTDEEIVGKNNTAVGIAMAGYYLGLMIAIAGVVMGPASHDFWKDLLNTGIYSVIAIILMNISRVICDNLILYKFDEQKELVDDHNAGTGAVMAGTYLATGFIISASVSGEVSGEWWKGLLSCIIFFVIGQLVLILAGLWYRLLVRYDVHKVIEESNNAAAGMSFGGFMFAVGYIASTAMSGESVSWGADIVSFVLYVIVALIFLSIGYWITDVLFLPKATMSDEVGKQGNIAASALSVAVNIGIAILIVHVL
ncbi:MAG: hypothetical protein QG641_1519 [Candidatus Poribacteria bacterium]|nr:hypothetical protein [Candidatus Poribacteria bacterium]